MRTLLRLAIACAVAAALLILFRPDPSWYLGFVPILVLISLGTLVFMKQPGTYLYATQDKLGHRIMTGTRYEVPLAEVAKIRGCYEMLLGTSELPVIAAETADGRRLLTHHNPRYSAEELQRWARAAGVDVDVEW
jgi:hypothetical protein